MDSGFFSTRPDNAYFANNEQALLVLFITNAEHNLIKIKLYYHWISARC